MRSIGLASAGLAALVSGCVVFEPPRTSDVDAGGQREDDAGAIAEDAAPPRDAGLLPVDAQAALDAYVAPDAGAADAGVVRRPALASCGFGAPRAIGTTSDPGLDEVSGIVASRRSPRVLWMVEDSGSAAVVYAVNDLGRTLASYRVSGSAIDYEDIAIGPGPTPGVDYLYVGDIGDNDGSRVFITIFRAPEPDVSWDQELTTGVLEQVEPLPMTYPAGMRDNAEAFFVDPATQDVYLITKNGFSRPNVLFRLAAPHTPAVPRELEPLGALFAGAGTDIAVTSASISPDGRRIVTRGLRAVNHYTRAASASIAETLLQTQPCDAPVASEPKGESISLASDGYFTISEGVSAPIWFVPFDG